MRTVVTAAAALGGLAVGVLVGLVVGVAVPNTLLPPGVASVVLGMAGAVGFAVAAARAERGRQDGNARRVRRPG